MVGISTITDHALNGEGLMLHFGWKNADDMPSKPGYLIASAFVSREECDHIYEAIKSARRKYWRKQP